MFALTMVGTAGALFDAAIWAAIARVCGPEPCNDRTSTRTSVPRPTEPLAIECGHEADMGTIRDIGPSPDTLTQSLIVREPELTSTVVGLGIAYSAMNLATTIVSLLLAACENIAGFRGIEIALVVLAGLESCCSVELIKIWIKE
jgi:hypothetical protein